jgi:hypothetical protein
MTLEAQGQGADCPWGRGELMCSCAARLFSELTIWWCRFGPTIYTMCDIGDSCIMSLIMRTSRIAAPSTMS